MPLPALARLLIASFTGWVMVGIGFFSLLEIMGAYLGRIYSPSKGRTLFMIGDVVGGPNDELFSPTQ